jgi:Glutamyl- and glutaminyl-tRNA synthetases
MEISHVLRGDEWIASTPRHVLIYEAFGWQMPQFAHMPVILSSDGGKLSKRKGAASVMDYKRAGFLPEALFNFLSLLGWSPGGGDEREKMSRKELVEAFSLEHISPKAAVFDEKKLEWMNGRYLEEIGAESIVGDVALLWKEKGLIGQERPASDPYLKTVVGMLKGRSKRLTEIAENAGYFFLDPGNYEEKAEKKYFTKDATVVLLIVKEKLSALAAFTRETLEKSFHEITGTDAAAGFSLGALVHPTRLAISGVSFGPGLFELMEVLGKETVIRRIEKAINKIQT